MTNSGLAQVGINTTMPDPSAVLDVQASDKAFYPPRLSSNQRKAIVNPQPGAFVYNNLQGKIVFGRLTY